MLVRLFDADAANRRSILEGGAGLNDLRPLFDANGMLDLGQREHLGLLTAHVQIPGDRHVRLVDRASVFKLLFRSFTGSLADLPLPSGCFITGSAVLAALTVPAEVPYAELVYLADHYRDQENGRHQLLMQLFPRASLRVRVSAFLGPTHELAEMRHAVEELERHTDGTHFRINNPDHELLYTDPLLWDSNGWGPYGRSDVDLMIAADTSELANGIVAQLHHRLQVLDGGTVPVRTFNTISYMRPWPERHVQVVMYHMKLVANLLAFADLDCSALAVVGGRPCATARGRRALSHRLNLVPAPMLHIRKDTPKRVASYAARGFAATFLGDPDPALVQKIGEQLLVGRSLLDLCRLSCNWQIQSQLDDDTAVDEQRTVAYLVAENTAYSPMKLPRFMGGTAAILRDFFVGLGHQDALLSEGEALPAALPKLEKVGAEKWALWRFC